MAADIAARDLPDLRLRLLDFWNNPGSIDWAKLILGLKDDAPDEVLGESTEMVRRSVAEGELFYIDQALGRIADASKLPIHDYGFMPWDLPAQNGMMFFADGLTVQNMEWTTTSLVLTWNVCEVDGDDSPHGVVDIFVHVPKEHVRHEMFGDDHPGRDTRFDQQQPDYVLANYITVWFAEAGSEIEFHARSEDANYFLRVMFAVCHLMRQELAETTTENADRAARRRHQRAGLEPPQIRVNRLRHSVRPETTGESRAEWHHRWIVRGHWRRQWYPSIQAHRPKWIAAYPKGPEHAPLLGGEKVYLASGDDTASNDQP